VPQKDILKIKAKKEQLEKEKQKQTIQLCQNLKNSLEAKTVNFT